ncbi:hypothetical protein EB093_07430, partial [bacterium]|nr:hypothetical protein [bacterium]
MVDEYWILYNLNLGGSGDTPIRIFDFSRDDLGDDNRDSGRESLGFGLSSTARGDVVDWHVNDTVFGDYSVCLG